MERKRFWGYGECSKVEERERNSPRTDILKEDEGGERKPREKLERGERESKVFGFLRERKLEKTMRDVVRLEKELEVKVLIFVVVGF